MHRSSTVQFKHQFVVPRITHRDSMFVRQSSVWCKTLQACIRFSARPFGRLATGMHAQTCQKHLLLSDVAGCTRSRKKVGSLTSACPTPRPSHLNPCSTHPCKHRGGPDLAFETSTISCPLHDHWLPWLHTHTCTNTWGASGNTCKKRNCAQCSTNNLGLVCLGLCL